MVPEVEQQATATAIEVRYAEGAPDAGDWTVPGAVGGGLVLVLALVLSLRGRGATPPAPTETPTVEQRAPSAPAAEEPTSLLARLRASMSRTREALAGRIDGLFGRDRIDEATLAELEEVLLVADVGVATSERIVGGLRARVGAGETDPTVLRAVLRDEVRASLAAVHRPFPAPEGSPFVLLVVGVNGSGKTTTIGKLAARFVRDGHKVLLAAADTFRAAAADQLAIWAERAGADIVREQEGADPASVVYKALEAARARGADVVIVDTAGRLQTRKDLMEELAKVRRVIQKQVPEGPHQTLLVVDGTMGQNAMSQARNFHACTPLSGVVVTKLDGTAKGGMVLAIASEMALPVQFVGIGEKVDDLRPFEVDAFVDALV